MFHLEMEQMLSATAVQLAAAGVAFRVIAGGREETGGGPASGDECHGHPGREDDQQEGRPRGRRLVWADHDSQVE